MEALTRMMSLMDKNSQTFGDGVYLEMCGEMQKIYRYLNDISEPMELEEPYEPRIPMYPGVAFMQLLTDVSLNCQSFCKRFLREHKEIKRMTERRRKEAVYWYCYTHGGQPWRNMSWLDLETELGMVINNLNITVHDTYKVFYNHQINRVKEKLAEFST